MELNPYATLRINSGISCHAANKQLNLTGGSLQVPLYRRAGRYTFVIAAFVAGAAIQARADTLHVPGDFSSIQACIDAAVSGQDECVVAPGTYDELISFNGKAITLRSSDGPDVTIIDAGPVPDPGAGKSVVRCGSGEGPDTVLDGFTITRGTGSACLSSNTSNCGGGMFNVASSPTVTNCTFTGNSFAFRGGGIYNAVGSNPAVTNCSFIGNAAISGGAMYNLGNSNPTITNCNFVENSASDGGGIFNNASDPTVTGCLFTGNSALSGGGICNKAGSSPAVTNCTFSANLALDGGAMLNNASHPMVTNSILWGNAPDQIVDDFGAGTTVSFSDVQGGWPGVANIDGDPLFASADGIPGTAGDDVRLLSGSPCIDVGSNAAVPADEADLDSDGDTVEPIPFDLDGILRHVDDPVTPDCPLGGCGTPPVVDMGAYEFPGAPDCNGNGVDDAIDIAGAGTTTVFAEGMQFPEYIVASEGDYPPGFFVGDAGDLATYHVSPLGETVTSFAMGVDHTVRPLNATFAPNEFGQSGLRLFGGFSAGASGVHLIHPDGTVELFSQAYAEAIAYIPQSLGGPAAGKLLFTGQGRSSLKLVDADGVVTTLVTWLRASMFTFSLELAPTDFGQFGGYVFLSRSGGSQLYAFNLSTNELFLFASVPLPTTSQPGLRQISFSPVGWAAALDPALANERVLLVSAASGGFPPLSGGGSVSVWDQNGKMLASLPTGPDGLALEPRGLLVAKNGLLISDATDGHGWLILATLADFGLPDCDNDGILDECEIAAGAADCNTNGILDECEVDCNENGVPDQCDVESGTATDCNANFIPDSCDGPDCNDNGAPDACDLADGTSRDLNGNHRPDECDTFVGDFDDDRDTDLDDYAILANCLALSGPDVPTPPGVCQSAFGLNHGGDMDLRDVRVFQAAFTGSGE